MTRSDIRIANGLGREFNGVALAGSIRDGRTPDRAAHSQQFEEPEGQREVERFMRLGSETRIFPVIADRELASHHPAGTATG